MARLLVIGCGDVGYALALRLRDQGHDVTGLKRHPPANSPIAMISADICAEASLAIVPTDFDAVVFIVAPDRRQPDAYRAVYQDALPRWLEHFKSHGSNPFWLLVSSTSVYGQNDGEWVDETSPTEPQAPTSRFLLQAEQSVLADNAGHCVVRFAGIYGPGRNWLSRRLIAGESIQQIPPSYTNRIHKEDCVGVLSFLLHKHFAGERLSPLYLACDDDPAPSWDVMTWVAEAFDLPKPQPLVLANDAPQNKRCSNARLKSLGYRFVYPSYRDGYRASH